MMNVTYSQAGVTVEDTHGNSTFLWWGILEKERNKFRFANSVLVEIMWDFGRMGEFYQFTIQDKDQWAALKARMLGKQIYFGEIAGKHSEIYGVLNESDITETYDIAAIEDFVNRYGFDNGNVDFIQTFLEDEEDRSEDEE